MKKTLQTVFYLLLGSILTFNSFSYLDPDFGWHLRFGQIIWETRSLPHDQIFMWTLAGQNWVDHEWLSNLLTYGLWSAGGYILVSFFFILLILLVFWLINKNLSKFYNLSASAWFIIGILEIGALLAMRGHLGVRMQEFTILGLTLLLIIINNFRQRLNWEPLLAMIPLMYLWACMHAGFLMGLIVLAVWVIYEWMLYFFPSQAPRLNENNLSLTSLLNISWIALAAALITFATPYGFDLYHFLSGYHDSYFASHIQEWLSPYSIPLKYPQILGAIIAAVLSLTVLSKKASGNFFNVLISVLFIFLASRSMRHFPLLAIAIFLLIVPLAFRDLEINLSKPLKIIISWTSSISLILISILMLCYSRYTNNPFNSYCDTYPCGAANFLSTHPEFMNNKLLNHYNFGGYLIGTHPEWRLFIDGRLPQYQLNNHSALAEYNTFNDQATLENKLKEYDIKTVWYKKARPAPSFNWFEKYILGLRSEAYREPENLITYLKNNPQWQLVYEDRLSIIFVKK